MLVVGSPQLRKLIRAGIWLLSNAVSLGQHQQSVCSCPTTTAEIEAMKASGAAGADIVAALAANSATFAAKTEFSQEKYK